MKLHEFYGAVNFWLDRYGKAKQVKEPVAFAVKLSGIKLPNQGRSNPAYWSGRDKAIDWMMSQGVAKVVHTVKDLNVNYNGQLTRKQWRWIEDYAKKHGLRVTDGHGNTMSDYASSNVQLKESAEKIVKRLFEDSEPELPEVDYPLAGDVVDGREVLENVDNTSSISASLEDYEVLDGIREVPMSDFYTTGTHYSADGSAKIRRLAEMILHNNAISPLIVVVDSEGPYVLEGATRLEALYILGAKSFPALVVVDYEA